MQVASEAAERNGPEREGDTMTNAPDLAAALATVRIFGLEGRTMTGDDLQTYDWYRSRLAAALEPLLSEESK